MDVEAGVSQALEALAQRQQHDPATGRFVAGNTTAGTSLERSGAFWEAVEPLKRELVQRTGTALAVDDATPETFLGLVDAYAETRLFRQAMYRRLVELGGPITSKGKARALYTAYLSALDRETKLAITLGLERRQKPATTFADVVTRGR